MACNTLPYKIAALREAHLLSIPSAPIRPPAHAGERHRRPRHANDIDEDRHVGALGRNFALERIDLVAQGIAVQDRIVQHHDHLVHRVTVDDGDIRIGGFLAKLSLPWLQNGINALVFILPAIRSGRSEKNNVTGLTSIRLNVLVALSKASPFDVCTSR